MNYICILSNGDKVTVNELITTNTEKIGRRRIINTGIVHKIELDSKLVKPDAIYVRKT